MRCTSWHALDTQLAAAATAAAKCTAPGAAPAGYKAPSADFPTTARLQMDILAMALACDLTRVASLQVSTSTSQVTHNWLTGQTETHHNYSHMGPGRSTQISPCTMYNNMGKCATVPNVYAANNQSFYQSLAQQKAIDLWYAQQVAYLAKKLAMYSGAGSGTLLDQSVICWGNELDMGAAHNHDDTPFVLIGGANGKLKTGQMVTFSLDLTDSDPRVAPSKDRRTTICCSPCQGDGPEPDLHRRRAVLHRADHRDSDLLGGGSLHRLRPATGGPVSP